jgi:hypothetical protein
MKMPNTLHCSSRQALLRLAGTALLVLLSSMHLDAGLSVFDGARVILSGAGEARDIRTADFDNDGNRDFAVLIGQKLYVYPGNGDGTFDVPVVTSFAEQNLYFDVAQMDGDAFPDIVLGFESERQSRYRMYRGTGSGSFTAGAEVTNPRWCASQAVLLADMTADGRADLVTCSIHVFANPGGGVFGAPSAGDVYGVVDLYAADANGDGKLDVFLTADIGSTNVRLSNGDGTLQPAVDPGGVGRSTAGDFNADGLADVAYVDERGLVVSLRTPTGTYGARTSTIFVPSDEQRYLRSADLNGDGRADLVGSMRGHLFTSLSEPGGAPGPIRTWVAAGSGPLAVDDFNADGHPDALTVGPGDVSTSGAVITYLPGAAGGTFTVPGGALLARQGPNGWVYGSAPAHVKLSDVTGDGNLDAVVLSAGSIGVLPGTGRAHFGAEIVTPVPGMGTTWRTSDYTFGDFTGDGRTDVVLPVRDQYVCHVANGDGTYRQTSSLGRTSLRIGSGDFNGDGSRDVIVDSLEGIALHFGNGDGTFDAPVLRDVKLPYTHRWLTADVNNDAVDDVIAAEAVYLGSASGVFTAVAVEGLWDPAATVDLDEDGNLDIVEQFDRDKTVEVLLGNGDGTFDQQIPLRVDQPGDPQLEFGVAGDFNADGNVDILFGTTVILGDGAGSFNGYARYRYGSGLAGAAAADLDGNGSSDLVLLHDDASTIDVIATWTTASRDVPITVAFQTAPTTAPAGENIPVSVTSSGQGTFTTTGGVAFAVGSRVAALAELIDGTAQTAVRGDIPGTHALTARFGGDVLYAGAAATHALEITRAVIQSSAWLSPRRPDSLDSVHVVGALRSAVLTGPTGTVTVTVDGVHRGSGQPELFDIDLGMLTLGRRTILLSYPGDSLHLPFTQQWVVEVVKPIPGITLSANPPSSAAVGSPVTLTATFTNAPTLSNGTVTFRWRGLLLDVVPIVNGSASVTASLEVGKHYLSATYYGDETYAYDDVDQPYTVYDVELQSTATSLYLVTPCRLVDTRAPADAAGGPVLAPAATRSFLMNGRCGIPAGARALALNVTVVNPANVGFVTLFGGASAWPGTSTINYRTGRTRANNTIIPVSAGGYVKVYNSGPAGAHVIIDVTGYFQ